MPDTDAIQRRSIPPYIHSRLMTLSCTGRPYGHAGSAHWSMWIKGSREECMAEAKRLEREHGLKSWHAIMLDRKSGRWALAI